VFFLKSLPAKLCSRSDILDSDFKIHYGEKSILTHTQTSRISIWISTMVTCFMRQCMLGATIVRVVTYSLFGE